MLRAETESVDFTVRAAAPDDARAIAEVGIESWRAAYAHVLTGEQLATLDVDEREEGWRERFHEMAPRGIRIWVAERDGRVLGYAFSQPTRDDDLDPGVVAELTALYLAPDAWGQEVGAELLKKSVAGMRAQGFLQAILWVLESNERAIHFYERFGWRPDGKRDACYRVFGAPAVRFRYAL